MESGANLQWKDQIPRTTKTLRSLKSGLKGEPAGEKLMEEGLPIGGSLVCQVDLYRSRGTTQADVRFLPKGGDEWWMFSVDAATEVANSSEEDRCSILKYALTQLVLPELLEVSQISDIFDLWDGGTWGKVLTFPPLWTIARANVRAWSAIMACDAGRLKATVELLRNGALGPLSDGDVDMYLSGDLGELCVADEISSQDCIDYFTRRRWG